MEPPDQAETGADEWSLSAPPEILELAESCRSFALRAVGVELDYEPETLPVLDLYVEISRTSIAERPELEPLIVRTVAAYYGEVVRRALDGFWISAPADVHEWRLGCRGVLMSLNPAGLVHEVLAKGDAERPGPSGALRLAPEDEAVVSERLSRVPPVSEDEYHLLSTRLEALQIAHEALREKMRAEGIEHLRFEVDDYRDEEPESKPN